MANKERQRQEIQVHPLKNIWEDTTLTIEQAFFTINPRWKRRTKKPMLVLPSVILELQNDDLRESTLSYLANYLLEIAVEDPEMYSLTGSMLFSFYQCTMIILRDEVWRFIALLGNLSFSTKSYDRMMNVLAIYQCIAASDKARPDFAAAGCINSLTPLIVLSMYHAERFETIRAAALSVVNTLCQANVDFIWWPFNDGVVAATLAAIQNGSELSKEIGMHIIDTVLKKPLAMSYILSPNKERLLDYLIVTMDGQALRAFTPGAELSHQLMSRIINCYFRLCTNKIGLNALRMKSLSIGIMIKSFDYMLQKLPVDVGQILAIVITFLRGS